MAETHDKFITMIAGEASGLPPYRRVKIDGSAPTEVIFADASDGDSWIGVSLPMEGGTPADGEPVTIALRSEGSTFKVECSAQVVNGSDLYPENDGKVSDDAGTVVIGTAFSDGSGSGSIVEFLPNGGSGSAPDEEAIANADGTTGAGIVIGLTKRGVTASGSTAIPIPARKLRIRRAHAVLRNATTAATIKLIVGATDISATQTLSTADTNTMINLGDDVTEIPATGTLYLNLAATVTSPGVDVFVDVVPVA